MRQTLINMSALFINGKLVIADNITSNWAKLPISKRMKIFKTTTTKTNVLLPILLNTFDLIIMCRWFIGFFSFPLYSFSCNPAASAASGLLSNYHLTWLTRQDGVHLIVDNFRALDLMNPQRLVVRHPSAILGGTRLDYQLVKAGHCPGSPQKTRSVLHVSDTIKINLK